MKMIFIFELLNKCKGALAGSPAVFNFSTQRYTVFRHPRVVKTSISLVWSRQRTPLNNSKDDGIFILSKPITMRYILCAMGKALFKNQNFYGSVVGSGQSAYGVTAEVSAGRKDFVGAFSLFFLSFSKLATSSFPFVVFSFKACLLLKS